MKKKIILSILSSILMGLLFSSCIDDKYQDTKDAGDKYLEQNAASDTIQVLSEVIQYKVYNNNPYGEYINLARIETLYSTVKIKYTAYFIDGSFCEAINGTPLYASLSPGLQEVLRKMRTGSKWRVWLPQNLAYGSVGKQASDGTYIVDPYTALYCDIEFISIEY